MADNEVLVLCYHAIADLSGDRVLAQYGIPPAAFAEQMDSLLRRGFTFVSPDQFSAFLMDSQPLPPRAVLLTFDDCYEELQQVAREILQPRGIEAIAFAVTGMQSGTNEWDQKIGARTLRLADAAGMKEMARLGIEIGCHSRSHRPLPSLSDNDLRAETKGAALALSDLGLPPPRYFAYPHGQHDQRVKEAVRRAGFLGAFALFSRRADPGSDRFALPRAEILARDAGWRFRLKTTYPQLERLTRIRSIVVGRAVRTAVAARRLALGRP